MKATAIARASKSTSANNENQFDLWPKPANTQEEQYIRSAISFYSTGSFSLPEPLHTKYFSQYFILYAKGLYIILTMKDGFLEKDDRKWKVVFHRNLTRGNILRNQDAQYALSFRRPSEKWNLPSIVLISESGPKAAICNKSSQL